MTYRIPKLRLMLVRDSAVRVDERPVTDRPKSMADLVRAFIPDDGREHFVVVLMDSKIRVCGVHEVAVGTVDRCPVFVREVAKAALLADARGVAIAHNHPSGETIPSADDMSLMGACKVALKTVGVELFDSLVVSHEPVGYRSAREDGRL